MTEIHSRTKTSRHTAAIAVAAWVMASFLLASCATSYPLGNSVPLGATAEIRASLRSADRLLVYEGLPHQVRERELMEREAARPDVTRIAGYHFYTPARPAERAEDLRKVLSESQSYGVYTGHKTCGGFHPDYAISWSSAGQGHYILICYGCGEAIVSDGDKWLPYDLKDQALNEVRTALAGHSAKRPPGGP